MANITVKVSATRTKTGSKTAWIDMSTFLPLAARRACSIAHENSDGTSGRSARDGLAFRRGRRTSLILVEQVAAKGMAMTTPATGIAVSPGGQPI
jgi:hypothetical protein